MNENELLFTEFLEGRAEHLTARAVALLFIELNFSAALMVYFLKTAAGAARFDKNFITLCLMEYTRESIGNHYNYQTKIKSRIQVYGESEN